MPKKRKKINYATYLSWGLIFITLGLRLSALLFLPQLQETNYEEGGVGLMARHILMGDHIAFWWSQPYLGTLSIYMTAFLFWFLPNTTFILRLIPLFFSLLAIVFSTLLAKKLFKKNWHLITLMWWAVPPAFLLRIGLTVWNYINCVAYGNIILYFAWTCLYDKKATKKHWFLLGLFSGIAFWDHLICLCYLAATGLFILVHMLRKKATIRSFLIYIGGYLIGNFPFWCWNLLHHFETLHAMLGNKKADVSIWLSRTKFVFFSLMIKISGFAGDALKNTTVNLFLDLSVKFIYFSVLGFSLWLLLTYAWRLIKKKKSKRKSIKWDPFETPGLALIIVTFLLASGQVISSQYDKGIYLMPIYTALPLLFTAFTKYLIQRSKLVGTIFLFFFLSIVTIDNAKLFYQSQTKAAHSNKELITFLNKRHISHVYAHYRVAWALSFLSEEKITASDLFGFLNNLYYNQKETAIYMQPYFDAMREVDLSENIAFVTNKYLKIPTAKKLEEFLKILNASYEKETVENYTVFYNFKTPNVDIIEIPKQNIASLTASHNPQMTGHALDRNISTHWQTLTPAKNDMFFQAEFTKPKTISKILLINYPRTLDIPRSFKVETSLDGNNWQQVAQTKWAFSGLDWFGPHPKFNLEGKLGICFKPTKTKFIKITLGEKNSRFQWSIGEIFFYETLPDEHHQITIPTPSHHEQLLKTIKEKGIEKIFSSDIWNSFFTKYLPATIKTITLTQKIPTPFKENERLVDFNYRLGFFISENIDQTLTTLQENDIPFEEISFPSATLIITEPTKNRMPLFWYNDQFFTVYIKEWAQQLYLEGIKSIKADKLTAAIDIFQQAVKGYPNMGMAYEKLLDCFKKQHNNKKVEKIASILQKQYTPTVVMPIQFNNDIEFLGLDISQKNLKPGQKINITYYWKYPTPTKSCFTFIHFTNLNEDEILFQDDHKIAKADWPVGGIIKENRTVQVPDTISGDTIDIHLGLWDPEGTKERFHIRFNNQKTIETKKKIASLTIIK